MRFKHVLYMGVGAGTGVAATVYASRAQHRAIGVAGAADHSGEEATWQYLNVRASCACELRQVCSPLTTALAREAPRADPSISELQECLSATSHSTSEAAHSAVRFVRSLQHAWRQRVAELDGGSGASAGTTGATASVANFLAALAEGGVEQERHLLSLAGTRVLDWLLDAAVERPGSADQAAVQRWLVAVLADDRAASLLLERPGAPTRLLRLAARLPALRAALVSALGRGLPDPGTAAQADVAAAVAVVAGRGAELVGMHKAERREVQRAALQLLSRWAGASVVNCTAVADAGVGPALVELASASATGANVDGLQLEMAQLMRTLASECPHRRQLHMGGWLYHQLCFAADAAAAGNWALAGAALGAFAACLHKGCELPIQLMRGNALPLLERLAAQPASPMRPAIAEVVQALADGRGVALPLAERERWADTLLGWLVADAAAAVPDELGSTAEDGGAGGKGRRQLAQRLVSALAALAAQPGAEGLHIAHSWLAELITHLSRQVQPYGAVAPPSTPEPSSTGRRWYQGGWFYGGGSSTSSTTEGSRAAAPAPTPAPAQVQAQAPLITEEAERVLASVATQEAAALAPVAGVAQPGDEGGGWGSWRTWLWPFGSGSSSTSSSASDAAAAAAATRPSDSELSLYINAAAIGPLYARAVAAELLEASGRVGSFQEPPPSAEELMGPAEVAVYPGVAAAIDMDVADMAVCQALKVLCALASGGEPRRQWLLSAGILPLLQRLALEHHKDVSELTLPDYLLRDAMPLCVKRQTVRLLAMLSGEPSGAAAVQGGGWVRWLQEVALSQDCKLSSSAARTLLHIESALAAQRCRRRGRGLGQGLPQLPRAAPELLPERADVVPAGGADGAQEEESPGQELLQEAQAALRGVKRRLGRQLDAVRDPVPPGERLVLPDGVHLFDPLAPHHSVLAREGTASASADAPLLDVVFVHGIRGGAFATWRREGVLERGKAREALDLSVCWPSSWVAHDVPQARLLSAEYAAPVTGWEGESLSFKHTVAQLMDKLAAAGVGQRPVVFVTHSMGGLVVKEMLANSQNEKEPRFKRLASNAVGAVFYSVPHFGSKFADWGWQLRYIGVSPARAVAQLKTGPHLEQLNGVIRALTKSGQLRVLSFGEGQPTRVAYVYAQIVPHESAYPGYGDFVVLEEHDHINVCKPRDRDDPSYAKLHQFLLQCVRDIRLLQEQEQVAADPMQASSP